MQQFNKRVYLAGAISCFYEESQPEKASLWREKAEKYLADKLDIKCFNPCLEGEDCWKYPQGGVITQNYFYLQNCDIILVNLDKISESIATMWELSMAWRDHKSVIAFGETPWLDRAHMRSLISVKLDTLDDALKYIGDMYNI